MHFILHSAKHTLVEGIVQHFVCCLFSLYTVQYSCTESYLKLCKKNIVFV